LLLRVYQALEAAIYNKKYAPPFHYSINKYMRTCLVVLVMFPPFLEIALAQVPPQVHDQCLKAADYAGCVKANSSSNSVPSADSSGPGVDRFGLPKLDAKRFIGPDFVSIEGGDADFYTDIKSYRQLKNKGEYGRYFSYQDLMRYNQPAISGTSGYSVPITGPTTNCYGSAFGSVLGNYGSAFGSSNCTTNPGFNLQVPGTSGVSGGPRQVSIDFIIDCVDKTFQKDNKGGWKGWDKGSPKLWTALCGIINQMPLGEELK